MWENFISMSSMLTKLAPERRKRRARVRLLAYGGQTLIRLRRYCRLFPASAPACYSSIPDFEHWREWESICQHFNKRPRDEYFVIPRGRVLVQHNTGRGLIYHGDATPGATLKRIAKLFRLSTWTAQADLHYMCDADDLFDD